ncbi:Hint domain-containing protein [Roseibacterium sp. SDUM158017]|uniref:Hint domain-containing protein n=1 Tax=Roseicyclus salinarum TaxID=3036773 RepID=UPI002415858F|nr:Hint domain-containing protein [Roseibacterium sp. SDUM158017]MDG4648207.1 Hint domain-containing protein [Roseibacterium sp. SDUM158017]
MSWSWHGRALALETRGPASAPTASRDHDELRARAARAVRSLLQRPATCPAGLPQDRPLPEDGGPTLTGGFVVSDGARFHTVVPIAVEEGAPPVLLFPDSLPRARQRHTVVACSDRPPARAVRERPAVICFTPGTRLSTLRGEVAIEDLDAGDRLLTRDDGPQKVLWRGHRRMSGARLFALPDQRPVRLRAGSLGVNRPGGDLVVSPEHRVLVTGRAPRELWGEAEVFVRAGDLVGGAGVTVDHSLRETVYIHLMLERHQVIRANGLEVESFHPGFMGLDTLSHEQREALAGARPDLAADPFSYGAPARRMLDRAEAAILFGGPAAPPRAA